MIVYFEGPDQSRKTTTARAVSTILNIPFWERAPYRPHHHSGTTPSIIDNSIAFHSPDSIWYTIDDMKTIEVFKKMPSNLLVDRHPRVSECVYRRLEGKPSPLEYDRPSIKDEVIVLCHLGEQQQPITDTFRQVIRLFGYPLIDVDTTEGTQSMESVAEMIYEMVPRYR